MECSKQSFIEVNSDDVAVACKNKLEIILNYRKRLWEESVQSYVKSYNNSWWNKLVNNTINYSEAENMLKSPNGFISSWAMNQCIEMNEEDICNLILAATKKSNDGKMFLTISDMDSIGYI